MSKKSSKSAKKTKTSAAQRQKKDIRAEQARRQMGAVVLFAIGLLFLALTFIKGSKAWLGAHNILFGLLGWSAYFIAPLILYIAVLQALDKPISSLRNKLIQTGVLIFLISSAIEIFTGLPTADSFGGMLSALYEKGVASKGGGVLAYPLAGPLLGFFDSLGAKIIILLVIFVVVMFFTGSTLLHLVKLILKPVESVEKALQTNKERRQKELTAPLVEELDFSLPLEEDSPGNSEDKAFENHPLRAATSSSGAKKPRFNLDVDISEDTEQGDVFSDYNIDTPEVVTQETVLYDAISAFPDLSSEQLYGRSAPLPQAEEFGREKPVEFLVVDTGYERAWGQSKPAEPPRQHPLSEDIRVAQKTDVSEAIESYLEEILSSNATPQETNTNEWPLETTDPQEVLANAPAREATPLYSLPPISPPTEYFKSATPSEPPAEEVKKQESLSQEELMRHFSAQKISTEPVPPVYQYPPIDLLETPKQAAMGDIRKELMENGKKLVETLESFGVKTSIHNISRGPAVTRYELQPSAGVKISRITGLADDIALNLAASGIRIEAPIPNKAAVGVEIPNKIVSVVSMREIVECESFQRPSSHVSIALGKDISGEHIIADIAKMPHVLIAGATGSGKSVCINSIIISILYKYSPDEVKLLMVDPKVVELGIYNGIPHLLVPVVTNPKKAAGALAWAVSEMLKRYNTFAEHSVRDIYGYNKLAEEGGAFEKMPQIVIIIDELADLMMAAPNEVEDSIMRLAQMARAAGMHLVIATQRPSVDVITGVIKANIPSRIAFAVSSHVDSRTILDYGGAEKLLGRGDMLFYPVGSAKPTRVQGCFVSDTEVERVVNFVKKSMTPNYDTEVVEEIEKMSVRETTGKANEGGGFEEEDDFLGEATRLVVEAGEASVSMIQRRLRVGYARAGRLIDTLEQKGIVGPHEGSKPRQVLMSQNQYMEMLLMSEEEPRGSVEQGS